MLPSHPSLCLLKSTAIRAACRQELWLENASNSLATVSAILTSSALSRNAPSRSRRSATGVLFALTTSITTSHEVCRSRSPIEYLWYREKFRTAFSMNTINSIAFL